MIRITEAEKTLQKLHRRINTDDDVLEDGNQP